MFFYSDSSKTKNESPRVETFIRVNKNEEEISRRSNQTNRTEDQTNRTEGKSTEIKQTRKRDRPRLEAGEIYNKTNFNVNQGLEIKFSVL